MVSLPEGREEYYEVRDLDSESLSPIHRAARFIYLNRFCFNGLYRTNFKGKFNVPYGAYKSGKLPSLEHLKSCAGLLKKAELIQADFRKTLSVVEKGDFVYLDPPYAVSTRRMFVEYGAQQFSLDDLDILVGQLRILDRRGAIFVLSYADLKESRKVFRNWKTRRILTRRNMAGFSAARKSQFEVYVTNSDFFDTRIIKPSRFPQIPLPYS